MRYGELTTGGGCTVQGRVTDHRVGHTEHNMDRMMDGDLLEPFISALTSQAATDRLLNLAKTSSKAS